MVIRRCRAMVGVCKNAVVFVFTVMLISSYVNGDTSANDVSALNVLYASLNNPASLTNWVAVGGDPCAQQWFGVTCTGPDVTNIKLSGMGLTGTLGYNMQNMTSLLELDLSNNNLGGNGPIPYNLPPNLERLNLGGNQFGGSLPYSISLIVTLQYLNIGHNVLQGNLTDIFGGLTNLSTLDLSFNSLTGDLPLSFSNLQNLTSLHLENNQFTGPIDVLANLPLQDLDVANNRFTGWIPDQLQKINNLQTTGNSWNTGPAPPPPPFTAPPPPRKIHPGHQSGENNKHPSQSQSQSQSHSSTESNGGGISAGLIAGIVAISVLVLSIIIAFLLIRRKSQNKSKEEILKKDNIFNPPASDEVKEYKATQTSLAFDAATMLPSSLSLKPPPMERQKSLDEDDFASKPVVKKADRKAIKATVYSVADLQIATDSFSMDNLVGEGSFGRVYKAQFSDGKVLAVKKINNSALPSQSADDFLDLVSNLSNLHHPNLSELVGYCCEHGQYLLVYEFYKTGSLHDLLHLSDEFTKPLSWGARIKVALGTARALEYLHEVCSPSLVHKNLKSSNILLDAELSPHLSDYGLDSLTPDVDFVTSEQNTSAPEVAMSGQYTMKSDVYSFGAVMLELMTGRKPFDSTRPRSEQLLVRWAIPQLHDIDALDRMIDPTLKGLYPAKSLSRFADVIALCVQPEPEFRPPMSEVVQALVRLVQRANMSKRVLSGEGLERRNDDQEEYLP